MKGFISSLRERFNVSSPEPDSALFDNLNSALAQKQAIINNQQAYYYTVTVSVKHERGKIFGCIKDNPYYTYHDEQRFNHAQYNQDIANADLRIHQCQVTVNNRIHGLYDQVHSINSQVADSAEKTLALKGQIASYQSKYSALCSYNSGLNSIVQQERKKLYSLQSEISQKQNMVSSLPSQIKAEKSAIEQEKAEVEKTKIKIEQLSKEFAALGKDLFAHVSSIDDEQRAFLLAELFDKPNTGELVRLIKTLGFDSNVLGELAITKNHRALIDLAIEHQADFENYALEKFGNKTLLQYAISISNPGIITKILAIPDLDFACTLLNSLKQDDIAAIVKLLTHDPALGHKQLHGFTLLHSAIWSGKYEIAQNILQLDESTKDALDTNGESAFKVAIRSSNPDMIKLVAGYTELEVELRILVQEGRRDLLDKLFELNIISTEMNQSLLADALLSNNLPDIKYLKMKGASIQGLPEDFKEYVEQHSDINFESLEQSLMGDSPTDLI